MQLTPSKSALSAIGLVMALSVAGPQLAQAEDDYPLPLGERVSKCKKIVFFDKIFFKIDKKDYYHPDNGKHLAVIVQSDFEKKIDLKKAVLKVLKDKYLYPDDITIIDDSLAAVCVKFKDKDKDDNGKDKDW
jgi:hypothetical protein